MDKAGIWCYKIQVRIRSRSTSFDKTASTMCRYFWWRCKNCLATQEYVLMCQLSIDHMPCNQSQQATPPLPLINPAPTCQLCGVQRGARRPVFGLSTHRYTTSRGDLDPGLKAISNDTAFWTDPSLRLPNFKQTVAKYNDARSKALEKTDNEKQEEKKRDVYTDAEQLRSSWQRLCEGVTAWPNVESDVGGDAG